MAARWDDNQPIYWQLRRQTVAAMLDGSLAEGDALPSVRQVAVDFQVNPLTVSKAYQSLVDDGIVEKRRGIGMFVVAGAREKLLDSERQKFLAEEWPRIRERIESLGLDPARLLHGNHGPDEDKDKDEDKRESSS
ncbi:MAG: GntR family transcriptional regulator [Wenzhouxiangellaceae bacterium]|nr:GntR family transcriptional regulator [Wenzhouxiangellaceae bacterium]